MSTPTQTPEQHPQDNQASRPKRRLSRKQGIAVGVAAVVIAAAVGGGAWALSRPQADTPVQAAEAVSPFDLTTGSVASRPRIDEVAEAVAQLKDSGFTPVEAGTLTVAAAASAPPLDTLATDDASVVVGSEADIAQLVADGLGLKLKVVNVAWADWPLGVQSGKYDAVISNVTVTEARKKLFDFATTRQDLLGFLTADSFTGGTITKADDISGLTVAVGSGTNQEKVLLEWNKELAKAGKKEATLVYYDDQAAILLALDSGRIDAYLGPNPTAAYSVKASPGKYKVVGTIQGGWPDTAPIGVATAKGNGLIEPIQTVLQAAIDDGAYTKVLERWGLEDEAITKSEINPPGIPESVGS